MPPVRRARRAQVAQAAFLVRREGGAGAPAPPGPPADGTCDEAYDVHIIDAASAPPVGIDAGTLPTDVLYLVPPDPERNAGDDIVQLMRSLERLPHAALNRHWVPLYAQARRGLWRAWHRALAARLRGERGAMAMAEPAAGAAPARLQDEDEASAAAELVALSDGSPPRRGRTKMAPARHNARRGARAAPRTDGIGA